MAVKLDAAGNLFVGGRERVFVFESDGKGGFGPRRELLRFPQDSIIIGLEFRGEDLYVLASHALYLVPGGRVRREGLTPKRILWGVPLDYHVSFHCLAWGPDGELYLDHGDPLLNYGDWSRPDHWGYWTLYAGPDGTKVPYTGAGAVLKVHPDGSNPRVVARGLRGPVGLAFDRNWNLFTNDNDHESRPDQYTPARLLHVSPHADFGWPRGWMASKSPDRADLLDCVHPALGRGVPCDLTYYDDAVPQLCGSLLMCRWDRFAVTQYPLKPKGASFLAEEVVFAQGANQCRPTGITVDTAGRVFVTCHYLAGNVVTPHCQSDLVLIAPDTNVTTHFDETKAKVEDLWAALSEKSWDMRRRAHLELLRRGGGAITTAIERLKTLSDDDPAAAHLPWLVAATGTEQAFSVLAGFASDSKKPTLRLQAMRALAASPASDANAKIFLRALDDPNPAVQLAGLEGLAAKIMPAKVIADIAGSYDPVLRQTAATLLARNSAESLALLYRSQDARIRLGTVLAAGIALTAPAPNAPPPQGVKLHFPAKSAFFSPELRFADAADPVDITKLGPVGSYTTAERWATVKHSPEEEQLFKLLLAALDDRDDLVASQAAYYLGWLRDPRSEPAVARVRLELRTRGLKDRPTIALKEAWGIGRLADAKAGQVIERGPIDLSVPVVNGSEKLSWQSVSASDKGLSLPSGHGNAYAYFRIQSRLRQTALLDAGKDVRIWHNGRSLSAETDGTVLVDLQPGSNDILLRTTEAGPLNATVRARETVSLTLPEKTDSSTLAERLKEAKNTPISPEFLKIDWATEGKKGSAERGRKLFGTLGCVKCHAITSDQAGGGAPSLAEAGKRFTPAHLAESVLLPDRLVAEEFRATRITTTDEQSLLGLVVRESPTEIELLLPDTTRRVVKLTDIATRKQVAASPMPAGLVKTPDELRDLITYLLSDNPLPP
jgi:putative heme-binding domain-containing protein